MTTKTDTEQERAEFEAFMRKRYPDVSLKRFATGCYLVSMVRHHWEGWKNRAALQSQDREDAFIDGVLLGLQVIAGSGNAGNADHDELMRSAGIDLVVRRAIDQEMWELAGLDRNQISIKARRRIEDKP